MGLEFEMNRKLYLIVCYFQRQLISKMWDIWTLLVDTLMEFNDKK